MFIGHFALGFAAKRAAPQMSLATLFGAAQLADILWPVLVATGVEHVRIDSGNTAFTPLDFVSYPYSHSLAMLVLWAAVLGLGYRYVSGRSGRAMGVLAVLVLSHWILDWISHRPDMPLYPGGPRFGLGLWNSIPATIVVELAMLTIGLWFYLRSTCARDAIGRWSLNLMVVVLLLVYLLNTAGRPPSSVTAIWVAGVVGTPLLLAWSWWTDRHRQAR
jgi:hypothetical protein